MPSRILPGFIFGTARTEFPGTGRTFFKKVRPKIIVRASRFFGRAYRNVHQKRTSYVYKRMATEYVRWTFVRPVLLFGMLRPFLFIN